MQLPDFYFSVLSAQIDVTGFDCGDPDINDFLISDALSYQIQRIANTYVFFNESGKICLFFSISNDCLNDLGLTKGFTNTIWNRFHRKNEIPNSKRIRQYPAIKIGRLGIDQSFQGLGLANQLLDFIKGWIIADHKPACRLLLLDAYNKEKQIRFYQRNDFIFLLDNDSTDITRIMYFDLMRLQ